MVAAGRMVWLARCVPPRGVRLNDVCSGCGLVAGEEDLLDLVVLGVQFPIQRRDLFRCGGARLAADPRADRYVADLYSSGSGGGVQTMGPVAQPRRGRSDVAEHVVTEFRA